MREIKNENKELSKYRLTRAKEDILAAETLYNAKEYRGANNRAYYAIFHAIRAVLATDGYDSKKHSGVIAEFRKNYIKTGIFQTEISDMIGNAFLVRNASDYDDMFIAERSQTEKQILNAKNVIGAVEKYLSSQGTL